MAAQKTHSAAADAAAAPSWCQGRTAPAAAWSPLGLEQAAQPSEAQLCFQRPPSRPSWAARRVVPTAGSCSPTSAQGATCVPCAVQSKPWSAARSPAPPVPAAARKIGPGARVQRRMTTRGFVSRTGAVASPRFSCPGRSLSHRRPRTPRAVPQCICDGRSGSRCLRHRVHGAAWGDSQGMPRAAWSRTGRTPAGARSRGSAGRRSRRPAIHASSRTWLPPCPGEAGFGCRRSSRAVEPTRSLGLECRRPPELCLLLNSKRVKTAYD